MRSGFWSNGVALVIVAGLVVLIVRANRQEGRFAIGDRQPQIGRRRRGRDPAVARRARADDRARARRVGAQSSRRACGGIAAPTRCCVRRAYPATPDSRWRPSVPC